MSGCNFTYNHIVTTMPHRRSNFPHPYLGILKSIFAIECCDNDDGNLITWSQGLFLLRHLPAHDLLQLVLG